MPNLSTRWSLPLRVLHWTTVFLLLVQYGVSFTLIEGVGMIKWLGPHVIVGVCIAVAIAARLVCRLFDHGPAPRRLATRVVQAALYVVLLAVTATGWLAYRPSPFALRPMLVNLPVLPVPQVLPWGLLHEWLVWLLMILIVGHSSVAVIRAFVMGDQTLRSMSLWPPKNPTSR